MFKDYKIIKLIKEKGLEFYKVNRSCFCLRIFVNRIKIIEKQRFVFVGFRNYVVRVQNFGVIKDGVITFGEDFLYFVLGFKNCCVFLDLSEVVKRNNFILGNCIGQRNGI